MWEGYPEEERSRVGSALEDDKISPRWEKERTGRSGERRPVRGSLAGAKLEVPALRRGEGPRGLDNLAEGSLERVELCRLSWTRRKAKERGRILRDDPGVHKGTGADFLDEHGEIS